MDSRKTQPDSTRTLIPVWSNPDEESWCDAPPAYEQLAKSPPGNTGVTSMYGELQKRAWLTLRR